MPKKKAKKKTTKRNTRQLSLKFNNLTQSEKMALMRKRAELKKNGKKKNKTSTTKKKTSKIKTIKKAAPSRRSSTKKKRSSKPVKKTTTTRSPSVPLVLVELGRLVELQTDSVRWKWTAKEDWIVCSNESGKRLFLFPRPPKKPVKDSTAYAKKGERLYKIFNHRKSDKLLKGKICDLKRREGRAIHIIYRSDKFGGRASNYIHSFDKPPIVWVNSTKNPKIVALTGGDIRITTRGIEG